MTTITLDELETRLREVIEELARGGEPVSITRGGVPVAELNPSAAAAVATGPPTTMRTNPPRTPEEREAYWAEWDRIGAAISETWPTGVSALDAIREDRSRLDEFSDQRHEP